MITRKQRVEDFLTLKLKDAKNDQIQLKALIKETESIDRYETIEYQKSLDNHVSTLETLLNK